MEQDWVNGLIGGLMIGSAAALFLLVNGRIMGASGILGGLIDRTGLSNASERLFFIAGLIAVPAAIVAVQGGATTNLTPNTWIVIAGGLLVGLGTRIANGCTSGHGVCGISRLSIRGIMASVIYIGAGAVTVALCRQVLGVV